MNSLNYSITYCLSKSWGITTPIKPGEIDTKTKPVVGTTDLAENLINPHSEGEFINEQDSTILFLQYE